SPIQLLLPGKTDCLAEPPDWPGHGIAGTADDHLQLKRHKSLVLDDKDAGHTTTPPSPCGSALHRFANGWSMANGRSWRRFPSAPARRNQVRAAQGPATNQTTKPRIGMNSTNRIHT